MSRIKKIIKKISNTWYKIPGLGLEEIRVLEKKINLFLPEDYKSFLEWSNGGEGDIGGNYLSLWKIQDLKILNEEYQVQKYLSEKYLAIGTDGGGGCYGFNIEKDYTIFKCPLGDLDISEVSNIAGSFENFLERALLEDI